MDGAHDHRDEQSKDPPADEPDGYEERDNDNLLDDGLWVGLWVSCPGPNPEPADQENESWRFSAPEPQARELLEHEFLPTA